MPASPCTPLYSGPILAPMVRASFSGMRALAVAMGASLVFTGAIIGDSLRDVLVEVDRNRMLAVISTSHRSIESPSRVLLSIPIREAGGRLEPALPLVVQLTINEHDDVEHICRTVAPWCVGVDLNLGCGASFAVSGGRGQRLVDRGKAAPVIGQFTEALQRIAVETGRHVSFSVKQRLLESVDATVAFIQQAYDQGVSCVTVHMRRKGEDRRHTAANWDMFFSVLDTFYTWLWQTPCGGDLSRLEKALGSFQIVANGDLCTRDAIAKFFSLSEQRFGGLPGDIQPCLRDRYGTRTPIMLARGAISDLTLFSFVNDMRGDARSEPSPAAAPPCFLSQAKALLEASERMASNFNNYKYTVLQGIALARDHNLHRCAEQRLAYKYFNRALQTPKSYAEYRILLDTLSSEPYGHWAAKMGEPSSA